MFIPAGFPNEKPPIFQEGLGRKVGQSIRNFGERFHRILSTFSQKDEYHPTDFVSFSPINREKFVSGVDHVTRDVSQTTSGTIEASSAQKDIDATHSKSSSQRSSQETHNDLKEKRSKLDLDVSRFHETQIKIAKVEVRSPWATQYFDKEGVFREILQKGTKILLNTDSSKKGSTPIYGLIDEKSGKLQAYAKIKGVIHTDSNDQESIEIRPGYIRAAWLDGALQKKNQPPTSIPNTKKTPLSFAGYIGPDGREIPPYIMQAVTVKYMQNVISPKIQEGIAHAESEISQTRATIIKEVLAKKIPLSETKGYKMQIASLKKKESLTRIETAIQSCTINGRDALTNPTVTSLLESIQKTPKWQEVIQQASIVYKASRLQGKK